MKECQFYEKLDSKIVKCRACRHFCKIRNQKTGKCGIRFNDKGKLKLLVFGKVSAVNLDPIEKKPLFHFLPGSKIFSVGTLGCNFRCDNCQNFEISQVKYQKLADGFFLEGKPAYFSSWEMSPLEIVKNAKRLNAQSIAYTYNEPTVFCEYALETMKIARKEGLKNIWISNGYMSEEVLEKIIPLLDAVNIDIKSIDDNFYQKICGAKLEPVLENCQRLIKVGVWLEVTTLIIPGFSDQEEMLKKLADFIAQKLGLSVPWHLSAFRGEISWKMKSVLPTSLEKIKKAYKIGKKQGLRFVYGGNVANFKLETTFCPSCQRVLIERKNWKIKRNDNKGQCPFCQEKIVGIWQ